LLGLPHPINTAEELLERIMRRLYSAIREEAETISRMLERIEQDIFVGKGRQTVEDISRVGRILLRFETALERHAEALSVFLAAICTTSFFGKKFEAHAMHISAERNHVAALVRSYRSAATELRNANDSLLNYSQNQVMKTLTIMAFVTFPLTLITSMFGMNTHYLPIVGSPGDFWIIVGIMTTLAASFFAFFRFKHWL
ncbi:CorA family divalent cation transporter, partial [Patescibacteria group bacterium]|nr:CorA family divalent cation transporter [Patescibacteria group bacterium]MBU1755006.1 CorA family divalent cation transporter [Patescibacteria group bacterium]